MSNLVSVVGSGREGQGLMDLLSGPRSHAPFPEPSDHSPSHLAIYSLDSICDVTDILHRAAEGNTVHTFP